MMRRFVGTAAALCMLAALLPARAQEPAAAPFRLAIAGLVHGHERFPEVRTGTA